MKASDRKGTLNPNGNRMNFPIQNTPMQVPYCMAQRYNVICAPFISPANSYRVQK